MEDCPQDPNLRTGLDAIKEIERVEKIRDEKNLNSHCVEMMKSFMKKLVSNSKSLINPFSKGVMGFDDFNYKYFNEEILKVEQSKILEIRKSQDNISESDENKDEPKPKKILNEDKKETYFDLGEITNLLSKQEIDILEDLKIEKAEIQQDIKPEGSLFDLQQIISQHLKNCQKQGALVSRSNTLSRVSSRLSARDFDKSLKAMLNQKYNPEIKKMVQLEKIEDEEAKLNIIEERLKPSGSIVSSKSSMNLTIENLRILQEEISQKENEIQIEKNEDFEERNKNEEINSIQNPADNIERNEEGKTNEYATNENSNLFESQVK